MSTDINFLLRKDEESVKRQKKVQLFNFISVVFLAVTGLISLAIFLLTQAQKIDSIKTEQETILQKISQFQDRKAKLFIAQDRINNITEILEQRKDLSKTANILLDKTPNNLLIENLEIEDAVISLTARSASLSVIGEFIDNLTDMVRKKEVASLTLNSLALDEGKNLYQVSLRAEL